MLALSGMFEDSHTCAQRYFNIWMGLKSPVGKELNSLHNWMDSFNFDGLKGEAKISQESDHGEDSWESWPARRSHQSILKEISPEYSLEELMLKVKLQYFAHLMETPDSLEKTLMLGKIEGGKRRGWQRMKWLPGITDSMDMSLSKLWSWWRTGKPGVLQSMRLQRFGYDWATELNWDHEESKSPRRILMSVEEVCRAGQAVPQFTEAFNWLDEAHLNYGRQSALLQIHWLNVNLIQNTLTETPRIMFDRISCLGIWPIQVDTTKWLITWPLEQTYFCPLHCALNGLLTCRFTWLSSEKLYWIFPLNTFLYISIVLYLWNSYY